MCVQHVSKESCTVPLYFSPDQRSGLSLCWAGMGTVSSQLGGGCSMLQEECTEHAEDTNKITVSFLPGAQMPLE